MQPPFTTQPAMAAVMAISLIIWRVLEAVVDVRTFQRMRAGAKRQDRGSHVVLLVLLVVGILGATALAYRASIGTIPFARTALFWVGIVLINTGVAFRLYAISVLGAFFTTSVTIAPQQTVVERGPYHYIRHPAYAGLLMILLGYGLCLANWLSLLVLALSTWVSLGYRIRVEERVLQEQLGEPYRAYMRRTKRLIPFVL